MKVQLVTAYRVSPLQRYGVTVRDNVTSVDAPLQCNTISFLAEAQVKLICLDPSHRCL